MDADKENADAPKANEGKPKFFLGRPRSTSEADLRAMAKQLFEKLKAEGARREAEDRPA